MHALAAACALLLCPLLVGQSTHEVCAVWSWYLPAGHAPQFGVCKKELSLCPAIQKQSSSLRAPAPAVVALGGHWVHVSAPSAAYFPVPQVLHSTTLSEAVMLEAFPAGQLVHCSWFVALLYVPTAQA